MSNRPSVRPSVRATRPVRRVQYPVRLVRRPVHLVTDVLSRFGTSGSFRMLSDCRVRAVRFMPVLGKSVRWFGKSSESARARSVLLRTCSIRTRYNPVHVLSIASLCGNNRFGLFVGRSLLVLFRRLLISFGTYPRSQALIHPQTHTHTYTHLFVPQRR